MARYAIHISVEGRKHLATLAADGNHLTVSAASGKKTVEVDPKVQHQVLANRLLEQLV